MPIEKKKNKTMFICPRCGPFVRVYKELWTDNSDGPYKIEFIQHIDGRATVIDEVVIKSKPDGEPIIFSFCGECSILIKKDKSANWIGSQSLPF